MGIKQLTKLIRDLAPNAIREQTLADLNGRKLAIDASMAIYQFLVAVRANDAAGGPAMQLASDTGEVTSHLQGMWYRTIKFAESGIRPVYVFDGKPPTLKSGELAKRAAARVKATAELELATEEGNIEDMERFSKRIVKMDQTHIEDCKKLLRLMGMPVVDAPCEAEAQCAILAKADLVYAAASEDMDTLTFGAPRLVRRLWASEASKLPVLEFNREKILQALDLTDDQFVDLCILAGCDYAEHIKGIAANTAYKRIKEYGNLQAALDSLDKTKCPLPENTDYTEVRRMFSHPEVEPAGKFDLKWNEPDEEGIKQFLVVEKGFNAARVESGIAKLKKARSGGSQLRMDSFFKSTGTVTSTLSSAAKAGTKRKPAATAATKKRR